jgi:hypothetical protein
MLNLGALLARVPKAMHYSLLFLAAGFLTAGVGMLATLDLGLVARLIVAPAILLLLFTTLLVLTGLALLRALM